MVQVSEKCYYINCPAKIGVYVADGENAYLVDSGNDKDAGRKVRQILEKNGWHLAAILNTHSNADHIGGNKYLQGQTGCKVYSGGIEEPDLKAAPQLRIHRQPAPAENLPREPHHEEVHQEYW